MTMRYDRVFLQSLLGVFLLSSCIGSPESFSLGQIDVDAFQGPMVLATDPPAGSYGVPTDYPVAITFNEAVRPETVLTSLGIHGLAGTNFPFAATLSADRLTLRITAALPAQEVVQLVLRGTLLNRKGVALRDQDPYDKLPYTPYALTITTGSGRMADPPQVLFTIPADGSVDVSPLLPLRIGFGKKMNPALMRAALAGPAGEIAFDVVWKKDNTEAEIQPLVPLHNASRYRLTVPPFADVWGAVMRQTVSVAFVTQKAGGHLLINEVVTDPKRDWNDTAGGDGDPFGPVAGTGAVTTSDEWVELYNGSPLAVNLAGWTLEMQDGTDQSHAFGSSIYVTERFSSEGSSVTQFEPGTYLVLGNPVGDMLNVCTLILRDANGFEQDRIALGADGAPSGFAAGVSDESVARVPTGADTDTDAVDWRHAPPTPGSAN